MDPALEPLRRSPRLPAIATELAGFVAQEAQRRQKFYDEMNEEQKTEFINGEVIVQSPAKARHLDATKRLMVLLHTYVEVHHVGRVFTEKALVCLTRNDYEPDIVFFIAAKATRIEPAQMKFPAPDFVVEVLSPSTEERDRGIKFEDYAQHGVTEYWIVDADAAVVEQYVLGGSGAYELKARKDDGDLRSVAISGFTVPVRAIFDDVENLRVLRTILA
jgi:Uma2 family endonuclease